VQHWSFWAYFVEKVGKSKTAFFRQNRAVCKSPEYLCLSGWKAPREKQKTISADTLAEIFGWSCSSLKFSNPVPNPTFSTK